MSKNVNLLVCVNPSVPLESIGEADIFEALNPVVQVLDIKIISRESVLKAFVKVDENLAPIAISELHGKSISCGKLKLFLSHKQYINYEKPPCEAVKSHSGGDIEQSPSGYVKYLRAKNGSDKSGGYSEIKQQKPRVENLTSHIQMEDRKFANRNTKNISENGKNFDRRNTTSSDDKIQSHNTFKQSTDIKVIENANYASNSDKDISIQQFTVLVTHNEKKFMERSKVSKIFRKIGRVVNITHDLGGYRAIAYRSENEMLRALKAMTNSQFFGYKLHGTNLHHNHVMHSHSLTILQEKSREIGETPRFSTQPVTHNSVLPTTLRIVATRNASIEKICKAISRICMPTRIMQAQDHKTRECFYLTSFNHCYEAAEVLVRWQECGIADTLLEVRFEHRIN